MLALIAIPACSVGEVIIHVDTDAPVPAPGTSSSPVRPPWLFDRLRVEVLRRAAPAIESGARREFAVDEPLFRDARASFGISPPPGDDGLSVRLRLFRGAHLVGGEPPAASTIDATFRVPAPPSAGTVHVTALLLVDDVGQPRGLDSPLDPAPGPPDGSLVGSWPGASVVPCEEAPGDSEVCVPGGAFWFGDGALRGFGDGEEREERLAVVSPFFVDLREVTVGEFRERWRELAQELPATLVRWNGTADVAVFKTWCTFTSSKVAADPEDAHRQLPINCLRWSTADAYCRSLDMDLPTEAQFEFLASGRGEERAYPWGLDEPTCGDAVFGRAGLGFFGGSLGACRPSDEIGGPLPPGSSLRDHVDLVDGTGAVRHVDDLAGNLSEFCRDEWTAMDDPWWGAPGVLRDPVVHAGSTSSTHAIRAGNWGQVAFGLRAGYRTPVGDDGIAPGLGFRCVRDVRR